MFYYDIAHFVNVQSNFAEVWSKATLVGLLCPANFSSSFRAMHEYICHMLYVLLSFFATNTTRLTVKLGNGKTVRLCVMVLQLFADL